MVGLPVLAAEANDALADPLRRLLTLLAGLLLVFTVLFAVAALGARGGHPADPDRAGHRLVGARPVPAPDPAQPDVGRDGRARDRDLDRVQRAACRPATARSAPAGRSREEAIEATYALDRRRRAGLGDHGDHGLRRADRLGHPDAARLRRRDGGGPDRVAARRDGGPAGGTRLGRAAQLRAGATSTRAAGGARCARSSPACAARVRACRCRARGCRAAPVPEDRPPKDRPPEDRFGDLGPSEPSAAERFAELDEGDMEAERQERERKAPGPPRPAGRYTWVVGIAALDRDHRRRPSTRFRTPGRGYRGPEKGKRMPGVRRAASSTSDAGRRREHQAGRGRRRRRQRHARVRRRAAGGRQRLRAVRGEAARARADAFPQARLRARSSRRWRALSAGVPGRPVRGRRQRPAARRSHGRSWSGRA